MVKFIPALNLEKHSFDKSTDELLCTCLIGESKILVGFTDSSIRVYNVENGIFSNQYLFSTVGVLVKIIYCKTGKFIGTIEHDVKKVNVVRVYVNWNSDKQCMVTEKRLRVRVASKVTPAPNTSDDCNEYEMIELPLQNSKVYPVNLACCQMTGNIAIIQNDNIIVLYKFFINLKFEKLEFIDFTLMDLFICIDYVPDDIVFSENIIVLKNKEHLNAFKVIEEIIDETYNGYDTGLEGKNKKTKY